MNVEFSPELEAFRAEVAEFFATAPTPAIREAGRKTTSVFAPFDQCMEWHKILAKKGWAAPHWPVEYGGTGWSVEQRFIFAEEYRKADLPPLLPQSLGMVGPLLIDIGTEEQKAKYLSPILAGEDFWAQGYSEPGSGSDLASLQCRAEPDGDDYIINGSKIWTTYAHHANRMFMLVRTDNSGKKQQGITFLLLDRVDYPGMEIRPIVGLDGVPEQCEVFFDNVRVPQSGRVGEENDGWSVAKHLLKHERGGSASSPTLVHYLDRAKEAAAKTPSPFGGMLADDPVFQSEFGELHADVASLGHMEKLAISGHPIANDPAFPSLNKTINSELLQRASTLMSKVSGVGGLARQLEALRVGSNVEPLGSEFDLISMPLYLNSRAASIYAGSNEVQRDLISRSLAAGV
ncbi:acyl-CoA dehydrogenase family protein [Erythrobacter sp. SCSIO 43205]|uniref:acyl-CoA dehydrogenase family protein n=1 Tax=Erythrobacter sp. SCSIO 43205 TaxID=2779361 RepID=UPI001CA9E4F5|nr:acyl-CoA dehydrogenase family protein [Erythrobacter sp. SCSIO 43205]UAB77805.1 acyl-CoA dehydrogenase family protein [Erythrobacter sp. SCSIO 43205]